MTSRASIFSSPSDLASPSATAFSTAKIDSPGKAACKCSTRPLTKGAFDKSLHQEPRALHSGMPWVKLPTDLEVRHGTAKPKRRTDAKCTILLKSTSACCQRLRAQTAVLATVFCFKCSSIQSCARVPIVETETAHDAYQLFFDTGRNNVNA